MLNSSPLIRGRIDGIPAHELLEGLGQLHQLVVVTDIEGVVQWTSRGLARGLGDAGQLIGWTLLDLCLSHLAARDEARDTSRASLANRNIAISRQLDSILSELERRPAITHHRLDLGRVAGVSQAFDVNAFRVESDGAGATPPTRLYVGILRPVRDKPGRLPLAGAESGLFGAVVEEIPDGLLAIDQSGFIHYANPAACRLLGKPAIELNDKPVALFLPKAPYLVSSSRAKGDGASEPIEVRRPEGGSTWLSISARPLRIPGRRPMGQILHLKDVSEERRKLEKLEKENAVLETYVHSVSHDLRSPLVSLLGFSRLLRQDYQDVLDEKALHFLTRIEQAGQTMEMLIRDLLELSRIERPGFQRAAVDPRNVLLQIHAELKPRLDEVGISLVLPSSPPMLRCERTQLYQIFSNLIGNALQHMGPVERPEIRVDIVEEPGQHVVIVRDNGKGIAATSHERIFEPFHSLGKRERVGESTGIGLAIVKKIALFYEGRVWVQSEPDRGASFFVTLPHG